MSELRQVWPWTICGGFESGAAFPKWLASLSFEAVTIVGLICGSSCDICESFNMFARAAGCEKLLDDVARLDLQDEIYNRARDGCVPGWRSARPAERLIFACNAQLSCGR